MLTLTLTFSISNVVFKLPIISGINRSVTIVRPSCVKRDAYHGKVRMELWATERRTFTSPNWVSSLQETEAEPVILSRVVFDLPFRQCGIAWELHKKNRIEKFWSFQIDLGHPTLCHRRAILELQWIDGLINRTLPRRAF